MRSRPSTAGPVGGTRSSGETPSAVRHALAAGDVDRAAVLVELAIPGLQRTRQDGTIRGWVDVIPDEVVRVRPVLAALFVGALTSAGEFDDVERPSGQHRAVAGHQRSPLTVSLLQPRPRRRPSPTRTSWRACRAWSSSTGPRWRWIAVTWQASPGTPGGPRIGRLRTTTSPAPARPPSPGWRPGATVTSRPQSVPTPTCVEGLRRVGHVADVLGCSIALADIRLTQGRVTTLSPRTNGPSSWPPVIPHRRRRERCCPVRPTCMWA